MLQRSIIVMVGHGNVQVDMVLEKELRVLHPDRQASGKKTEPLNLGLSI